MAGQGYLHPQLGFAIVVPDASSLLEEAETRAVFAIDREAWQIDELPASRVVLQRRDDSGEVVVLDEWRIAQDGRGWIISAFCPIAS